MKHKILYLNVAHQNFQRPVYLWAIRYNMINRNIWLLYVIKTSQWFMLYMPVIFLFYTENGFSTTELFGLHAVYSIVIAVLEVPSGYVADVWGRKSALILGTLFGVFGFAMYSFSYTLVGFIIAELLLGVGESFVSGADSALLYDTLEVDNKEKHYLKTEGRLSAAGNISEALAGLFVSIVVFHMVRGYFVLQTFFALLAFIAACFLIEPELKKYSKKVVFNDIIGIVRYTFKTNKLLGKYIIFSSIIGFASLVMAWFSQPIFFEIGLAKNNYGYAWVILNAIVAIGSIAALRIGHFFGKNGIFVFLSIAMSLGLIIIALNLSYLVFVPLALFYFIRGSAHPILKNFINNHTSSDKRATVLSLRSLLIRIMYSAIGPFLGVISDKISIKLALMLCGVSILIPAVIFAIVIVYNHRKVAEY
jgi:MFS family permease